MRSINYEYSLLKKKKKRVTKKAQTVKKELAVLQGDSLCAPLLSIDGFPSETSQQ